jgi:hypothetical protein
LFIFIVQLVDGSLNELCENISPSRVEFAVAVGLRFN